MRIPDAAPQRDGEAEAGRGRSIWFSSWGVLAWGHLNLPWSEMTGLEITATGGAEPLLAFHRGPVVTRFRLPGRTPQQVRDDLRSWVVGKANEKIVIHLEWNVPAGESGVAVYERRIRARKITKDWVLGWVETAETQRRQGNETTALSILEAVVEVSTASLGPTAAATVAARNNWAFTLGVNGGRGAAIPIYWTLLDDATAALGHGRRPRGDDRESLEAARRNALRNLAMLHNPRWRP
ncbi:hypothetical protein Aab01nite_53110 [Paractinoplanes abujensis]|uniref:Uncharacterized protein n=1 Tax=Paractinoplanes abujensis TaxID=882441 RepID=A0A7W7CV99_9ACTN|nr:hypothetical protein [Actinoplanes abujensis]MBB4693621.1 hypothetical protein [Actinoplanes abujensis]GID21721.1 hypothetical protein Aab01nite_53110 [Actinoplanes abujensis]